MSRITRITGPDGKVTTVVTRRSGCGCGTALLALFVLFAPAALFPGPFAVVAYTLLGTIAAVSGAAWVFDSLRRVRHGRRAAPTPPRVPAPPPFP